MNTNTHLGFDTIDVQINTSIHAFFVSFQFSLKRSLSSLCPSPAPCCPEEGADPESIEKVALQVLAIKLPVNQTALNTMIMQIKESLLNVTDVEGIVNQTSQHIAKAKELLDRAKDAK